MISTKGRSAEQIPCRGNRRRRRFGETTKSASELRGGNKTCLAVIHILLDYHNTITFLPGLATNESPYSLATAMTDKSHHNQSGGGFTNPWPSFRNITIFQFMVYARKSWNREASKVPPQSELFVKVLEERQMAWERIRNPPKDRIQATW